MDPIRYDNAQYLKIAGLKVYLPRYPEVNYGDKVIIEGVVENGKLKNAKTQKLQETENFFLKFRRRLIDFYQETLPEPYAGLLGGIVLGVKSGLTNDFWGAVRQTGVAHVVVASGMNVTFVASFLIVLLALFLPRKKLIPFVILGIFIYLFISGFAAPLVRAAIMGTLAFLAQETGRVVSSWRVLFLAAFAMLVFRPEWLVDLGFILSFVATASILLFEKKIRQKLARVPKLMQEGLSTSLAAQIGVTPILYVTFGYFNILSPVVNTLVLWTIAPVMVLGVLGGIAGLVAPFLGKLILYLSYPLLWWFTQIVYLFAK